MDHMGYVQENAGSGNETSATGNYPDPARGKKRSLAAVKSGSTFREMSIDQEARSVALELGLLSLNSDTPQKHYLGSSSGSLFAPLFLTKKSGKTLVADAQSVGSSQDAYGRKETPQAKSGIPTTSHTLNIKNAPDALYEQLRKVCLATLLSYYRILLMFRTRTYHLVTSAASSWIDSLVTCILITLSSIGPPSIVRWTLCMNV